MNDDLAFLDNLNPGDAEKLLPNWTARAAEAAKVRDRLLAMVGQEPSHTVTVRGFKRMICVPGDYGGYAEVKESSSAEEQKIWLKVVEPNDLNAWVSGDESGGTHEAHLLLTASKATALARQIEWLLRNHYQGNAWPEET